MNHPRCPEVFNPAIAGFNEVWPEKPLFGGLRAALVASSAPVDFPVALKAHMSGLNSPSLLNALFLREKHQLAVNYSP
jgi:hypothetical protein